MLTNAETAEHIRKWCNEERGPFAWPTDGCGYEQHIRFVKHRNSSWHGGTHDEWLAFCRAYADSLED